MSLWTPNGYSEVNVLSQHCLQALRIFRSLKQAIT